MKVLYNEEGVCCTEIGLLSFMHTLPLPKLDIIGARLELNGLIFSGDIPVDIYLVTFWLLLLSNVSELNMSEKKLKKIFNLYCL